MLREETLRYLKYNPDFCSKREKKELKTVVLQRFPALLDCVKSVV